MEYCLEKKEDMVALADAVRNKSGVSGVLTVSQMTEAVDGIDNELPTLTNPGSASDMLRGKQFIDESGKIVTGTIPSRSGAIIVPSASFQLVADAETYLLGEICIEGDENLLPKNIRKGVTIFGVEGSYINEETASSLWTGTIDMYMAFTRDDGCYIQYTGEDGNISQFIESWSTTTITINKNSNLINVTGIDDAGFTPMWYLEGAELYDNTDIYAPIIRVTADNFRIVFCAE